MDQTKLGQIRLIGECVGTLVVCLLTYNRYEYAAKTLRSTLDLLKTKEQIHVHIADDGSPNEGYIRGLGNIVESSDLNYSWSNAERAGYGGNFNLAMQTVHQVRDVKWILPLEDDWELVREFNIDPILAATSVFGCIRMGYVGYTQQLRGIFEFVEGNHYIRFDPDSPEPHVFAGHPRIETVEYERAVGPWPTGMDPGSTEFSVAQRHAARQNVAWPIDLIKPYGDLFAHIGTIRSY